MLFVYVFLTLLISFLAMRAQDASSHRSPHYQTGSRVRRQFKSLGSLATSRLSFCKQS